MSDYSYRRTMDDANYAANRRLENRLVYAQQQVDWFYTDLLKAQHGRHEYGWLHGRKEYWTTRQRKAERDLAEAHARLAALEVA